jgi:hypothetical protein
MRKGFSRSILMIAMVVTAISSGILMPIPRASAQSRTDSAALAAPLKRPWGEPDLQGIWTDETDTPLQRPARYANQEFFTEAQRAEIDRARSELLSPERRALQNWLSGLQPRGAEADCRAPI